VANTSIRAIAAAAVVMLSCAGAARADDVWESFAPGDDTCNTNVDLVHGAKQVHDLQTTGPIDIDFARVQQRAFRSYEVRVVNSPLRLAQLSVPNRVDCGGVVQTAGVPFENGALDAVSIRWAAVADGDTYIRTTSVSSVPAGSTYEIELLESTYSIPRFNNTATQSTVVLLQNGSTSSVAGTLRFFSTGGTLLGSQNLTLPAQGGLVVATAGITGAAGASGFMSFDHLGRYGQVSGKAVALEPGTGFTFDTQFVPKFY
jgi:hypothetical protein